MSRIDLRNLSYEELVDFVREELGQKPFRARQIFEWIYLHNVSDFSEMTNISKDLRAKLDELCTIRPLTLSKALKSGDGSEKLQFTLADGAAIEAVLMPADGRVTLCISSQVGCAMGCRFCFTGSLKLGRNLETAEIVDQYRQAQRYLSEHGPAETAQSENATDESLSLDDEPEGEASPLRISNVVMMGMGEPLMNFENVVRACNLLTHDLGINLSGRKLTVSTCGIVPRISELAQKTNVNLAVSLNAVSDKKRSEIMPINKKYPLMDLIAALKSFPKARKKRIVLEYVLLKDTNDSLEDADMLAKIAARIGCKVNLIPHNPHSAADYQSPAREQVLAFQAVLVARGVDTRIRQSRGQDIYGACGMLGKKA